MLSAVVVVFLLSFGRGKRTLKSNSYENVNVFSGGPRKMCVCVYSVSLDLILLCCLSGVAHVFRTNWSRGRLGIYKIIDDLVVHSIVFLFFFPLSAECRVSFSFREIS